MKINIKMPVAVKSASVYVIANLLSRGLAIITVPIFTRLMTTDQIGVVNVYTSWFSMISAFSTLSLTSGGFALAMKEYKNERDRYVSSILFLTTLIAMGMCVIFFVNTDFWANTMGLPKALIALMLVGFIVTPARDFWLAKERYEYKYKLAAALTLLSALLASALSIVVIIIANNNNVADTGYYRLVSNYIVIYIIDIVIFIVIFAKGKLLINKEYWKYSLKLSLPLVGYSISTQVLNVSDRMMIDKMVGKNAVGIYGTLYTVSSLSIMIWTTINASFVPYLFENIEKRNKNIAKITNILLLLYSGIAILLTYLAPEIVRILATDEYLSAKYIMPPIAAGVFMISISNIYSNILVYYKKTTYIMYASIIAAVANIILNYLFIGKFGYMAAAYTTLFSYIILAILEFLWAENFDKKNNKAESSLYDNKTLLLLSIGTVVFCMFGLLLYRYNILRYVVVLILGAVLLYAVRKNKKMIKLTGE